MISRLFRFIAPTLLLVALHGVAKADIIYGSTSTQLFSINTAVTNAQPAFPVTTGLSNINGLAFDSANNFLYYRNGGTATTQGNGNFYRYNITTNTQTQIVASTFFTSRGIGAATNASFYNGNYWFVSQDDDLLVRFNPITQVIATFNNFDNSAATFAYNGDIAIDRNGFLYSSSLNRLFRVNISSGTPTGYTPILTNVASNNQNAVNRQLAFAADGLTLFGYKDVTGAGARPWATINTTTGATSAVTTPNNVRAYLDLASAQVVPEPGSIVLTLCGGGMLLGIVARRHKK